MKSRTHHHSQSQGVFLIQGLVYMVILAAISFVAFNAFFGLNAGVKRVQLVADDIMATMAVGEQWRDDIRNAGGTITTTKNANSVQLIIPQSGDKSVRYKFDDDRLVRTDADGRPTSILSDVAATRFVADEREHVTAWRWELTLSPNGPNAQIKPLFTFMAVPTTDSQ